MRSSTSVRQGLLCCVAFLPLVPCMPVDSKLPAQGAEIITAHSRLCKFSSLIFHSSSLPRHLTALLCLFLMHLFYYKIVDYVITHLWTMLLHCTRPRPPAFAHNSAESANPKSPTDKASIQTVCARTAEDDTVWKANCTRL